MKRYPHLISKLFEPLLLTPAKFHAICRVLESRLAGELPDEARLAEPEDPEIVELGSTAIIPVHGVIGKHLDQFEMMSGGCDLDVINAMLDNAEADASVRRVVLDFRSPGGTVVGVPETARKIYGMTKDTIAFTDSECCSGAIWLASQCNRFYGTQSSQIGSVGVWTAYLDMSRQLANEGVNIESVFAGKYKLLGAYWKPLTEEERAIVQRQVDKTYAQFKSAMMAQRPVEDEKFGNGLVFDGDEAAELGFTDGVVEDMDEVLEGFVE